MNNETNKQKTHKQNNDNFPQEVVENPNICDLAKCIDVTALIVHGFCCCRFCLFVCFCSVSVCGTLSPCLIILLLALRTNFLVKVNMIIFIVYKLYTRHCFRYACI